MLTDRLRRATAGLARRPTLLEAFAVSRAAESIARYGAIAAATLAGRARPDTLPASAVWYEVRNRLRPFTDAAPLATDERDLGMWAQRTHSELKREFGPPEQIRLAAEQRPELKANAVLHLQAMVNEIPDVADYLAAAIEQMADHGELHALASKLPFREYRVTEFLTRKPVVADRFDVMTVLHRLEVASELAAAVAVDLDRATSSTVGRQQPGRLAAHGARAEAARTDPDAVLVQRVADTARVQRVADRRLVPGQEPDLPSAARDLRTDIDDAESASAPEWDIE